MIIEASKTASKILNGSFTSDQKLYVSKETIDLIFENYQSDFLFYFFNNRLNKHIFSKTFKEHKSKLNEYRNKK